MVVGIWLEMKEFLSNGFSLSHSRKQVELSSDLTHLCQKLVFFHVKKQTSESEFNVASLVGDTVRQLSQQSHKFHSIFNISGIQVEFHRLDNSSVSF